MPDAGSQHCDKQVETGAEYAVTITAERDVEVVSEPRRERDMPSVPELCEVAASVGEVEILTQPDAKHSSNAYAYVAIAAEVKINLHGKAEESHQALETRIGVWHGENPIVILGDIVSDNSFFYYTQHEEP